MSREVAALVKSALILNKLDYYNSILANITKDKLRGPKISQTHEAKLAFREKINSHLLPNF